jgi:hypothetical protein
MLKRLAAAAVAAAVLVLVVGQAAAAVVVVEVMLQNILLSPEAQHTHMPLEQPEAQDRLLRVMVEQAETQHLL